MKGNGSENSATIGAPIVKKLATKFTIPNTVATNLVGKSLATETYPILKDIAPPKRTQRRTGMTQGRVVLQKIKQQMPPKQDNEYDIVNPYDILKNFKIIPLLRKAAISAKANKTEFR